MSLLDSYNLSRKKKVILLDSAKTFTAKCKTGLIIEFRCIRVLNKNDSTQIYNIANYERKWPDDGGFSFNSRAIYFDEDTKYRIIYYPA